MKIQGAICVKHKHIHLEPLIRAGILLWWKHYLSDSCLNILAEHGFPALPSLSEYQRACQSDMLKEIGHWTILFITMSHPFFLAIHAHTAIVRET